MASHTFHPDSHEFGLADGCPRCDEHAKEPFLSLDDVNLRELVRAVKGDEEPRSLNEDDAMAHVAIALRQAARLDVVNNLEVERLETELVKVSSVMTEYMDVVDLGDLAGSLRRHFSS